MTGISYLLDLVDLPCGGRGGRFIDQELTLPPNIVCISPAEIKRESTITSARDSVEVGCQKSKRKKESRAAGRRRKQRSDGGETYKRKRRLRLGGALKHINGSADCDWVEH